MENNKVDVLQDPFDFQICVSTSLISFVVYKLTVTQFQALKA